MEPYKALHSAPFICASEEIEQWSVSLGLAKHSFCCHQKTQRYKEDSVSFLAYFAHVEGTSPPGAKGKERLGLQGGQRIGSPLEDPPQSWDLPLLPCQRLGKGSPLFWTDSKGSSQWGVTWQHLDVTSFPWDISLITWIFSISRIPLRLRAGHLQKCSWGENSV